MRGRWAGIVVLIGLVACSKENTKAPGSEQGKLLRGTWRSACQPGAGDTFRQNEYAFRENEGRVEVALELYATSACLPPNLFSYHFSGTYRVPSGKTPLLIGEIREAYLTVNDPDYLQVAQRAPGLYGLSAWSRGNRLAFAEKISSTYLAEVSKALLPPDLGFLIEGNHLFIGTAVASRENPLTKVTTTAAR